MSLVRDNRPVSPQFERDGSTNVRYASACRRRTEYSRSIGVDFSVPHDKLKEALIKCYSVPFAVADGQDSTQLVRVL